MNTLWLIIGAAGSFCVALLHIAIIIYGARAYHYFGAGEEFAHAQQNGSWIPALITSGIVLVFAIFGVYALSSVGVIHTLPFASHVVLTTGIVYTLRGLVLFVEVGASLNVFKWRKGVRPQDPVFSAVSLALGVIHLLGWMRLVDDI